MPKVGGKEFSYSKDGIKSAKAAAEKSGKPMEVNGGRAQRLVSMLRKKGKK